MNVGAVPVFGTASTNEVLPSARDLEKQSKRLKSLQGTIHAGSQDNGAEYETGYNMVEESQENKVEGPLKHIEIRGLQGLIRYTE